MGALTHGEGKSMLRIRVIAIKQLVRSGESPDHVRVTASPAQNFSIVRPIFDLNLYHDCFFLGSSVASEFAGARGHRRERSLAKATPQADLREWKRARIAAQQAARADHLNGAGKVLLASRSGQTPPRRRRS